MRLGSSVHHAAVQGWTVTPGDGGGAKHSQTRPPGCTRMRARATRTCNTRTTHTHNIAHPPWLQSLVRGRGAPPLSARWRSCPRPGPARPCAAAEDVGVCVARTSVACGCSRTARGGGAGGDGGCSPTQATCLLDRNLPPCVCGWITAHTVPAERRSGHALMSALEGTPPAPAAQRQATFGGTPTLQHAAAMHTSSMSVRSFSSGRGKAATDAR